ncbi:MAG: hypothetical protein ABIW50_08060 [Candidatus Limnocylindria bacterium]
MRSAAIVTIALVLAACSSPGDTPGDAPSDAATSEPTPPTFAPGSTQPSVVPAEGERLEGRLGADSIEGGCGYLQADDGTRYEVIYPEGWDLRLNPLELRSPSGEVVARGGDAVTVIGGVAGDMASICQIGPIFRAGSVEG